MRKSVLFLAEFTLIFAASLTAQDGTGRIVGMVLDPTGATIANARITVTNTAMFVSRQTASDSDGRYQILDLPIGTYCLQAEKAGFTKLVMSDHDLLIGQTLRIDLPMTMGTITEVVQVSDVPRDVETMSSTLGQSVTRRTLVNMPLNGRNLLDLALLQPGVTETNSDSTIAPGRFSVGGGRTDSVAYLLDGGINNHILNNDVVYSPNPDMVAEFRILTSNYTAEYGRNGSGVVSVVTKSGSNDIHGSLFEFLRNEALNANTFFNNANNQPKPILKRNNLALPLAGPFRYQNYSADVISSSFLRVTKDSGWYKPSSILPSQRSRPPNYKAISPQARMARPT